MLLVPGILMDLVTDQDILLVTWSTYFVISVLVLTSLQDMVHALLHCTWISYVVAV